MRGCGAQKKTNPTGGRGRGKGGRKTFIDETILKSESSQRLRSRKPKPQHSLQPNCETEEEIGSSEIVDKPAKNIEDQASGVGEQEMKENNE